MCIFCEKYSNKDNIIYENDKVFAFYDAFPVSKGHILIVTKRHLESFFETNDDEKKAITKALSDLKEITDKTYKPDGYNIGVNIGESAGQTIMHLHIHLIPRYQGDTDDPRGGVRGVIPNKQKY